MKIRTLLISALIVIGFLYVACGQSPEKPTRKAATAAEKRSVEQKKAVRVKHLSGEVIAINSKTKTITVRFKDEDVELKFDDGTVVKIDLDSVKPSEIPAGCPGNREVHREKKPACRQGHFHIDGNGRKKGRLPPILLQKFCQARALSLRGSRFLQSITRHLSFLP